MYRVSSGNLLKKTQDGHYTLFLYRRVSRELASPFAKPLKISRIDGAGRGIEPPWNCFRRILSPYLDHNFFFHAFVRVDGNRTCGLLRDRQAF